MTKNVLIVVLAGINLFLLAGVILVTYSPPAALAQAVAQENAIEGDNYILIAAEVEQSNDMIYVLDVQNELLHMFRTNFPRLGDDQPIRVTHIFTRDVRRDFREQEGLGEQEGGSHE